MARLAATSRIAAHRSAVKLDFSISHDRNSVLILCIIVVAGFFFCQGSMYSVRLRSGAHHGETPRIGETPSNQPISELDIFS